MILADRLMVGLRFLVPSIGVRVPVRQQSAGRKHVYVCGLCCCSADRDSKDAGPCEFCSEAEKERAESGSRTLSRFGVEDEQIYLVIRDRLLARAQKLKALRGFF